MHEVMLAQAVWRQVVSEMERQPGRCLVAMHLVVGPWSGVESESLEFALGLLMTESAWPATRIHIRCEPLAATCRTCRREFEVTGDSLACPHCGGTDVAPVRGTELRLESLEVE